MAISHPIPIDVLRQLIRLDPETGRLYWLRRGPEWFNPTKWNTAESRSRQFNTQWAGTEALATPNDEGYLGGEIFGRAYKASRVVFALHHGYWPADEVDHHDRDITNNRPCNLREGTKQQNQRNAAARSGPKRPGTSRYCGVYWFKQSGKWRAAARDASGKQRHLGTFHTEVEAALAYDSAARKWHGEFARTNFPK